jgi:hypothetical protein
LDKDFFGIVLIIFGIQKNITREVTAVKTAASIRYINILYYPFRKFL